MPGPLGGVQVVELAGWVVGPSVAGVLADWGAEVVKIEPPDGDPNRAWATSDVNPAFELDNRGKRSVTLDLKTAAGKRIAHELLTGADVFVTNLRWPALESLGFDYDSLAPRYPRLVYASVTGYGLEGPDRDRPAYDGGAFWSRAGVLMAMTPPGAALPAAPGGAGDHVTAITAVAGVAAALFARASTGRGQHVTTSLLRAGMFMMGFDVNTALRRGAPFVPSHRSEARNPLYNTYRAGDGRWFHLLGLQPDRHWDPLMRVLGENPLSLDPRFATAAGRAEHAREVVRLLDAVFASAPLQDWCARFDRAGVWWAPVQAPFDLLADPQAQASGAFVEAPTATGTATTVASPVDFTGTPWRVGRRVPEAGEHTEEVLLELGYDWDAITQLREEGAFG
jgi:crotonobetainyl-CoA:carnitine CoA-transferase CaiB-like acyl-CoA transferase